MSRKESVDVPYIAGVISPRDELEHMRSRRWGKDRFRQINVLGSLIK